MKWVLVIVSTLQATSPQGHATVRVTNVTPIENFETERACVAVRNYVRTRQASSTADCFPMGDLEREAR